MLPARPLFIALCLGFSGSLAATLTAAPRKSPPPIPAAAPAPAPTPSWIAKLSPWKRTNATPPPAPPAAPIPAPAPKPAKAAKPSKSAKPSTSPAAPAPPEPIAAPHASPSWIARLTPWKRPATIPAAPSEPSADAPKPSLLSVPLAAIRKLRSDPAESLPEPEKIERPKDWQSRFIVADPKTALYEFGPSQPGGPDDFLPPGTVVTEVSRKRGWSLIEANGRSGYIDSQSLRNAQRADFSDPPPPPAPKPMMATSRTGTGIPWRPAAPPPDLPDEAPMMDLDGALDLLPPLITTP